ncbi:hypothetical protein JCGZ_20821 [Jatropha curcas]|uniref:Uncharacterized protein n=1 Tax=Jatropha curcas TaxID=180498 RepID=A0A067K4Z5_JATCU|nr:hypothetical protein JCGZ_20821 [Jatropha curcas]
MTSKQKKMEKDSGVSSMKKIVEEKGKLVDISDAKKKKRDTEYPEGYDVAEFEERFLAQNYANEELVGTRMKAIPR